MRCNLLRTDNKRAVWGGQDINEGNANYCAESHVVKWEGPRMVLGVGVSDWKALRLWRITLFAGNFLRGRGIIY